MRKYIIISLLLLVNTANSEMIIDNLENSENRNWVYFTDNVMGGVSTGDFVYINEDGENFYRMTGNVSTENNGGFIQFATRVDNIDKGLQGIKIKVRGNNEDYELHLRTKFTPAPWQYYSSKFKRLYFPLKHRQPCFQLSSWFFNQPFIFFIYCTHKFITYFD